MKFLKYIVLTFCYLMFCKCSFNKGMTDPDIVSPNDNENVIRLLTGDSTKLWICPKWHKAHSFSKKGFYYKKYIIDDNGILALYMTPQEAIDTTIFEVSNMNIHILLKGRGERQNKIIWNQDSIKYISQDTLVLVNPVEDVLFINSKKYNAVLKDK